MTLKRLRSAGLSLPLAALFFVPFVNLVFFLALSLWPERGERLTTRQSFTWREYRAVSGADHTRKRSGQGEVLWLQWQ
jgi:hypothetical protein